MSHLVTTIRQKRAWVCEAECDAPGCEESVRWALVFDNSPTPGLSTLYLCDRHTQETEERYAK